MSALTSSAFISYSRDDSAFALRLAKDLKAAGASVWLDQLDIKPGHSWDNAIEEAVIAAPQMLIVLSPSSARSDNVRDEISYALEKGKNIIPVLFLDCDVPLRLQRRQRIDFREDYIHGLTALLQYLDVAGPISTSSPGPESQILEREKADLAARPREREAEEARIPQKSTLTNPATSVTPTGRGSLNIFTTPLLGADSASPRLAYAVFLFALVCQFIPLTIYGLDLFSSHVSMPLISMSMCIAAPGILLFAPRRPLWQQVLAVFALALPQLWRLPVNTGALPFLLDLLWIAAVCILGIVLLRKTTILRIAVTVTISVVAFFLLQYFWFKETNAPYFVLDRQEQAFIPALLSTALFAALFFALPALSARRTRKMQKA